MYIINIYPTTNIYTQTHTRTHIQIETVYAFDIFNRNLPQNRRTSTLN